VHPFVHRYLLISTALLLGLVSAPARAEVGSSFVSWYTGHLAGSSSTTSLRREIKAVVHKRHAKAFLGRLEQLAGPLQLRDVPPPGKVFLTTTQYLNTGNQLPGLLGLDRIPKGSISPKIRIRTYQTRDRKGRVENSALTDGIALLELKMPHPSRPGVSLKPRLFVSQKHLGLLSNQKRVADLAQKDAMIKTMKADRRNDPQVVDRMVQIFEQLHLAKKGKRLKPWVTTRYQRKAFVIPLGEGRGDIQVTVDKKVQYRHPKSGKRMTRLKRAYRAVELKIPDAYARMSDRQLRDQGLGLVAEVRQLHRRVLGANQVPRLKPGKGKCSAFSRVAPERARVLKQKGRWRATTTRQR
jgi:hypothetical protein